MGNETKLNPCPFCGGKAELILPVSGANPYVMCVSNFCTGPKQDADKAIAAWNTRALPAAPTLGDALELPKIKALVEALQPLAAIADAFDENELDDEARKYWGTSGVCETPHDFIELYQGRGGKRLLTLADCMLARGTLAALQKGGA